MRVSKVVKENECSSGISVRVLKAFWEGLQAFGCPGITKSVMEPFRGWPFMAWKVLVREGGDWANDRKLQGLRNRF
jgi:hypothetical protein